MHNSTPTSCLRLRRNHCQEIAASGTIRPHHTARHIELVSEDFSMPLCETASFDDEMGQLRCAGGVSLVWQLDSPPVPIANPPRVARGVYQCLLVVALCVPHSSTACV